jgi:hypothetical protein
MNNNFKTENKDSLKTYFLDLTPLIKKLITGIVDKNNKLIGEFRFLEKEEYGPYKPYLTYNKEDPERTIVAVKLWLYMLFKKAYTLKHINSESIEVYVTYSENNIPNVYLSLSKHQYNKVIHPKNLGQFTEIKEVKSPNHKKEDLKINMIVKERDIEVNQVFKYNEDSWIDLLTCNDKYSYYSFKFNPFVF